jgi:hypothetical protein
MTFPVYRHDERLKIIDRRARNCEAQFMNTTDFSEQCSIAQQFGELCEEEDAMLHERASHTQTERMD